MIEQENIARIKILLKAHPRGLTITEVSQNLKMNRNSASKYLEILQISGLVESRLYGTARVFFLTHRLPISALVSITSDPVITLNENHHILFVNDSFCNFFSVKKEEVAEKHIVEIFKTGIGSDILPGVFSDIIAGKKEVHDVRLPRDTGDFFFKIKSMLTVFDDGSRGFTIIMEDVTREKRASIELAAKEARYRGIVEDQTNFVIRFLADGALSFVNTSFCQLLKKEPDTLLGTPFADTMHPRDRGVFDSCRSALTRENPVASFECRPAISLGPVHWIAWTLRVMDDCGREPVEYQAVGHDITEKKMEADRIDRHLSQMEFFSAKLGQFIEMPPGADIYSTIATGFSEILPIAAICVSRYDPGTNSFTVKAVYTERDRELLSPYIGNDLRGLKIPAGEGTFPDNLMKGRICRRQENLIRIICSQLPEETCTTIEEALNCGDYYSAGLIWRGVLLGNINFSIRRGEKLRNVSMAETYVRAASLALQRSLADDALAESEHLYRSVLDNIQDVYYRSDMEGNLLMISPSGRQMLGYSLSDEIEGKNIARDFYLDPEKRKELVNTMTAEGSVSNYEVVLKKKDGTPFFIETNSHFILDKDGSPLGIEGIFRDISERKAASRKIHQYIGEMEFLSQKLLEFISMDPSENIYRKIAGDLKTMVPDGSLVAVSSFDEKAGIVTVEAAVTTDRQRDTINRLVGQAPVGSRFRINETSLAGYRTGKLSNTGLSLYEVLSGNAPETVCRQLESELSSGDIYTIGFIRSGEVLGSAAIFLERGKAIDDLPVLETYAREASMALQRSLAEKAQRKSDEVFENIAHFSPLPIALVGPDDTFQYVNESFIRLFGYNLDDFHTVEEWLNLVFPDPVNRKKMIKFCKIEHAKFRPGYTFTWTCPTRCKDSTTRDIIVRTVVLSGMNVCMICEDITERNQAARNDRLLSSIIQSTADAIIGKDSRGTIISWNKAAEHLYGYAAEEMIGQHISRIFPPERMDEMENIFRQIGTGQSVGPLETQRLRKDGRVIDVSVMISPILDDAGTVIGTSIIARDISSEKAEARLRKSEAQYRSLVDNISVGLYRSTGDPAGHFIWGNSSLVKILGYPTFEQLKKVDIAGIFLEQDGRRKLLDDLKKDGFVKNREIGLIRADGKTVTVLVTALARFDTDGGLACINGVVQDISSQRQAEEQVQTVTREMQDILALIPEPILVVAHNNAVVAWNAAMELVTGIPPGQVLGRRDIDHLLPYHEPLRPSLFSLLDAQADVLERYYPGALREGATIIAQVQKQTTRNSPAATFTIRASPLSGPDGIRLGAVEIIHDTTAVDGQNMDHPPQESRTRG